MDLFTWANGFNKNLNNLQGNLDFVMVEENNYGKMDQYMKVIGKIIWLTVYLIY